ncbi:MAG: MaoC family dehydratase [Rhodospirillales bacterium]|nr:MaoC family dehydratase [Rhodospirillales bacterium]MBO6786445.1 MaoC family dehydratase [Rhodospirillales bacterium]
MAQEKDLYFEDFTVGRRFESAGATLTESQILDFAWAWDPQPFHIDVPHSDEGPYGGLISSGFHTMCVAFRLIHATGYLASASMGSPGIDELRWKKPVRPGDTLRVVAEVTSQKPSSSKPDRGTALIDYSVLNQKDEEVMSYTCIHILAKRS